MSTNNAVNVGLSGVTGSGAFVGANSPALVTPALGTPMSGVLSSCSGLPVSSGISGLGTGVATALAVNVGSAGAPVVNGGALGTPSSGTLSSCSGLPISSGVSGLGANVAAFLATPSSANLAAALTDESGSGAAVFANTPTLVTPVLGAATATSINGVTVSSSSGTLTLANSSTLATSGANSITLTSTGATNVTLPTSGTLATVGQIFAVNNVTGTSATLAASGMFIANNGSLVTLTLPVSAAVGDMYVIVGSGAGGWKVAQNDTQVINVGSSPSTAGTGGSVASSNRYDCVILVCIVANTAWSALGVQGNLTIV